MASKKEKDVYEEIAANKERQLLAWKKKCYIDLLGEDCEHIDALLIKPHISPHDLADLINAGCPKDLAIEILL